MSAAQRPYCYGKDCPIKDECNHYKEDIKTSDIRFSRTPYNHDLKICEFGPMKYRKQKTILNGRRKEDKQ